MSTDITLVGLRIDGVELDIQTLVDQQTDARQDINEIFPRLGNVENVAANNRWRIENIEDGVEGLVPLFQYLLGVQYTSFDGSLNALSGEIAENNAVIQAAMAAAATAEQGYQDNRDYIDEISFESRQAVTQEIYEELAVFQNSVDGQILSSENALSTQIDGVTSYIADNLYTRVDTDTAISLSQTELLSELAQNNVTLGAEFNEIFYTRTSVDGAVATALTTARAEYSDALVDINGTIDGIKSLDVDVIGGTAIGNTIEDLTVRANSASASISTQGTAIATLNNGASAGYLIRARAGNSVSLIDLVAADGSSQTPGSFAKIQADNILLQGSVYARHLTVTEQLISSSAQLGNAVITTAKIGNNQVTFPQMASGISRLDFPRGDTGIKHLVSLNVQQTGAPAQIIAYFNYTHWDSGANLTRESEWISGTMNLKANGMVIAGLTGIKVGGLNIQTIMVTAQYTTWGSVNYSLEYNNTGQGAANACRILLPRIQYVELKK